jgi:hypothetical protein
MKRIGILMIAAMMCACVALPASAESNYALFATYYDGSDTRNTGGLGFKADWLMGESAWGIESRLTYTGNMRVDTWPYEEEFGDVKIQSLPIDLGVNYHFMENQNLWLGAGITYNFLDTNVGSIKDVWGWYASLGYQTGEPGAPWAFFAEGIYRNTEGQVNTSGLGSGGTNLDTFDTSLNGLGLSIGVAYRF